MKLPLQSAGEPDGGGGVYHAAVRSAPSSWRKTDYVPRFLSSDFIRFLLHFLRHPAENPVFLREWRRGRRGSWILRGFSSMKVILLTMVLTLLSIPAALALREKPAMAAGVMAVGYFGISLAAGLVALLRAVGGSQELTNRASLRELAVTPLRADEVVFGHLVGSVIAQVLWLAPLAAPYALLALVLFGGEGSAFAGSAGWFIAALSLVPNAAATIFCNAAMASTVSFGAEGYSTAVLRALFTWALVSVLVFGPVYLSLATAAMFHFALALPIPIAVKLLVGGGFLNHLSWRLARDQVEEWHRE